MHRQHFSKSYSDASHLMHTKERIIIRQRCFQIITYRLTDGEIALPTRKMTAIAHKSELSGKQYMESLGIEPISVILPNYVVTDMIPILHACDFWKYLNESGKGNPWTKFSQQFLTQYLSFLSGEIRKQS